MPSIPNPFRRKPPTASDLTRRQVFSVTATRKFPSLRQWKQFPRILSKSERRVFAGTVSLFFLAAVGLAAGYAFTHRVDVPAIGGTYTEGLIGSPQFVNPLYAPLGDADADLTALVFSGLLKHTPEGLTNDLAESLEVSGDGLAYVVTIRAGAKFHNGEPVRARDVIFTIEAARNPLYRSPLASSFRGVSVSQINDETVAFTLETPLAAFPHALTTGILPADLWADIPPRSASLAIQNLQPVGSGPYRFSEFSKDKQGVIRSYSLKRNPDYYGDGPLLEELVFKFYADADAAVEALANRNVEGVGFVPEDLAADVEANRGVTLYRPFMPREAILYFNQARNVLLKDRKVREAIARAIDKAALAEHSLGPDARAVDHPIPPDMPGGDSDAEVPAFDSAAANALLDEAGFAWPEGADFRVTKSDGTDDAEADRTLSFSLVTVDRPEFVRAAERLQADLATVGIRLTLDILPQDELISLAIGPREYELLLSDVLLGADADPFPFWHSSGATEGLNLAGYVNRNADVLLEDARAAADAGVRVEKLREFQKLLAADLPAVFLYQSAYRFALPTKIKGADVSRIVVPSDRFANVASWYSKTKKTLKR